MCPQEEVFIWNHYEITHLVGHYTHQMANHHIYQVSSVDPILLSAMWNMVGLA